MALTNATTLADYSSGIGTQGATLKVDANNQRVGIGTVTPTETLDVVGNMAVEGDISVTGTLSYEDLTNVDAIGYSTFRSGINVQGAGSTTTTLNVTGVSTFGDKVSIGDSIFHTGDTDTSIRFPSAGAFAIVTNGDERIRIESGGDVGIGTYDPKLKVHIESGTPYIRTRNSAAPTDEKAWDFNAGTDGIFRFRNTNDAGNSSNNWLEVERDGVDTNFIKLLTGTGSERLRILSGGQVNIGGNYTQTTYTMQVTGTFNATSNITQNGNALATNGKAIAMALIFG